jgi:GTP cyclohydrolase II
MTKKVGARIPTENGEFTVYLYHSSRDPQKEHMAFVYGDVKSLNRDVLTRIHSECFTGEVVGSLRCDCREQLHTAQKMIAQKGAGVVVYLRQEGRNIGLLEKLKAYNLQDQGYDTVDANLALGHPADARTYDEAALILKDLGVSSIHLLTNNPDKVQKLSKEGIKITKRINMVPKQLTLDNLAYLTTKVDRMNHFLDLNELEDQKRNYETSALSSTEKLATVMQPALHAIPQNCFY